MSRKKYLAVELVEAQPMNVIEYNETMSTDLEGGDGYVTVYQDGSKGWCDKETFEKVTIRVSDNNTIEEHNINDFIASYDVSQWGDKTTVVHATLVNGFIITESSSCVDPSNFDMSIGESICKEHIHNKLWSMLGFMLQTGLKGVK